MRTHEEYKAEVLRRAERCRKERKKNRRRIAIACICLLLVCGVGYMALPQPDVYNLYAYQTEWPELYDWLTSPTETAGGMGGMGGIQSSTGSLVPPVTNTYGDPALTVVCVKISGAYDGSEPIVLTKAHEIKKLCEFLQTVIDRCPTDGERLDGKLRYIHFLTENGEEFSLMLQGNKLSDNGQTASVYLPKKMLEKFKSTIGE